MRLSPETARRLEERIARLQNVEAAGVHLDERGEVRSVDVIASRGRAPQRIVRDIEILAREADIDFDHRKIGVAVLDDPGELVSPRRAPAAPAMTPDPDAPRLAVIDFDTEPERVRVCAVHSSMRNGSFSVEVELSWGVLEGVPGRAEGPANEPIGCAALVGRATLDAVRNLLQPGYEAQLRDLRVVDLAGSSVVVVSVDFGDGRQLRRLVGACEQCGSLNETTVYAVLDALNRAVGRARFRELAFFDEGPEEDQDDFDGKRGAASA